jgi:hypothetical protein
MVSPAAKLPYSGYRFPTEVISQAVLLYFRFPLSLEDTPKPTLGFHNEGSIGRIVLLDALRQGVALPLATEHPYAASEGVVCCTTNVARWVSGA